jgi:hypothetical protein
MTTFFKKARVAILVLTLLASIAPAFAPAEAAGTFTVTTYAAENITQNSATLSGSAQIANPQDTWFDFSNTPDMQYSVAANSNGYGYATNLQPNTTYYFRYVVNKDGITCWGETRTFTTPPATVVCTPPTATTGGASNVTQTSATITGSGANSATTRTWFDFGTDQNVGYSIADNGGSGLATNLQPNTTYYYRYVVQNACGTARGSIQSFRTPASQPTTCTDPSASNYGGALPCTYPTRCTDPAATNYNQVGTCHYPTQQRCTDPAATNYNQVGACTYPSRCTDPTASNYNQVGQCVYPQRCMDPNATNYNQVGTCTYPQRCTDPAATNYNQVGQCTYPSRCTDPTASNYNQVGACTYPSRCTDPAATNYNQVGQCVYPQPVCNAPTASANGAISITQNSATLTSSLTSGTGNATYTFLFGTNPGSLTSVNSGSFSGSQSPSFLVTGLQPDTTYYYQVRVQNSCASAVNSNSASFRTSPTIVTPPPSCPAPSVTVGSATNVTQNSATLNGYVTPNGYATSYWFQYGNGLTTQTQYLGTGYQNVQAYLTNLNPNTSYSFTLVAQNQCGTTYGQPYGNFTTLGNGPVSQNQGPTVITDPATAVGRTSALLNGRVGPNGSQATGWFQYGRTTSLELGTTVSQAMGGGLSLVNYASPLSGLSPNTTYYFRAVGQNAYGTNYGQILSFTTGSGGTIVTTTPRPPVVITTTGATGGVGVSCLILTPTIQPQNPTPGQQFVYGITYVNNCPFDLQNASMRIYLPNEVSFSSTNYPFLTRDLNVITYNLGVIPRNFQSTILVRGVVNTTVNLGDNLIFKSDLSFTDPQARFQNVSAFLTAVVGGATAPIVSNGVGTASIFSTLFGFFTSGWFWFLLFLLLLALFILWLATRNRAHDVESEH